MALDALAGMLELRAAEHQPQGKSTQLLGHGCRALDLDPAPSRDCLSTGPRDLQAAWDSTSKRLAIAGLLRISSDRIHHGSRLATGGQASPMDPGRAVI